MLVAFGRNRQDGFTLIELMVTIVIVGILTGIALPSFVEYTNRNNVRAASETVLYALQLARGEAVRRNQVMTMKIGTGTGSTSWSVIDATGATIQASRASGEASANVIAANTPSTANQASFNGFGRLTENPDTSAKLVKVIFSSGATTYTRQIEIQDPGGEIRLCEPAVTSLSDPRRCTQ